MDDAMIRGHVLEHVARFYRSSYDHSVAARVEGELSVEVKAVLEAVSKADWYPRRYLVELLKAFETVRGSGDAVYDDFLSCGASLAQASNDFSRLLIKLMTPELFVKKLPRFWTRDHKGSGALEIEPPVAGQRAARVTLRNVKHYDHGAILWMGFIQGVLAQLGTSQLSVRQDGWSWSSPGPQEVVYEMRWS